ncbi:MAG: hypothetical protein ACOCV8_03695, partial [Spirochaetota bacterium]
MGSVKSTPVANKILAVLNLLLGGAGIVIGLIGTFGYAGLIGEPSKIIPTMVPLFLLSIVCILFSFIAVGAGFSLIKEEHEGIKKSKRTAILFLIFFVLYTLFSLFALYDFHIIGDFNKGPHRLHSNPILVSEVENSVVTRKLSNLRMDEDSKEIDDFQNVNDITRWLITPMRIRRDDFEIKILDIFAEGLVSRLGDTDLISSEYSDADTDDSRVLLMKRYLREWIKSKETEILENIQNEGGEVGEYTSDILLIMNNYEYDSGSRAYLLEPTISDELQDDIIEVLISIDFLRDFRVDNVDKGSSISETPTLFY